MRECDLLKAVEEAAFKYLMRLLINRIGRLLDKRIPAVLAVLIGAALADGLLLVGDIIGLIVAIGLGLWSAYDTVKTIEKVIQGFRNGMWQQFKKIPKWLLDTTLLDCVNRKPLCCELFQREVSELLVQWVEELKPGWKKGSPFAGSVRWRRMLRDIKSQIAGPLEEYCTR
jgi:hypothetical protein